MSRKMDIKIHVTCACGRVEVIDSDCDGYLPNILQESGKFVWKTIAAGRQEETGFDRRLNLIDSRLMCIDCAQKIDQIIDEYEAKIREFSESEGKSND